MTAILDEATAVAIRRRITFRLAALFLLLQLMNAIDRSNVSFAAATMNADLGFDARIYGCGVSCFFLSYMFFTFPAIFLMRRIGPSKDRKSGVKGKSVAERVDLGGSRSIKKK